MKILIVEDDPGSSNLLKVYMRVYGNADTAVSVAEAWELINKSRENEKYYDMIFVDVYLPGGNGIDLIERIKKTRKDAEKNMKIVVVSSSDDDEDKSEAKLQMVDAYMVKPINFTIFDRVIEKLFTSGR